MLIDKEGLQIQHNSLDPSNSSAVSELIVDLRQSERGLCSLRGFSSKDSSNILSKKSNTFPEGKDKE